ALVEWRWAIKTASHAEFELSEGACQVDRPEDWDQGPGQVAVRPTTRAADEPPLSVKAARDKRGQPAATLQAIVAAAVRRWNKEQHPRLELRQIGGYFLR
ncbi:unnamed protein product, partial [Prorocentrum cordatum]